MKVIIKSKNRKQLKKISEKNDSDFVLANFNNTSAVNYVEIDLEEGEVISKKNGIISITKEIGERFKSNC